MVEPESDEFSELFQLLEDAFDELHGAVITRAAASKYLSTHGNYPNIHYRTNGFPYFSPRPHYGEEATVRRNFVSAIRGKGSGIAVGLLGDMRTEDLDLPKSRALEAFIRQSRFSNKFETEYGFHDYLLNRILDDAVERYIQLFGTRPLELRRKSKILFEIFKGIAMDEYPLRVVVPIALTHFNFDRIRFNDSSYITRIPRGLQLARSRLKSLGSGATEGTVEAATHAFVSTGWSIRPNNLYDLTGSLNAPSQNVVEMVDLFFACLRAATAATTGYAQILLVPERWAVSYYVDLPPTYGSNYRRYPSSFDGNYYRPGQSAVTRDEISEAKRIYNLAAPLNNDRMVIALKRLNACMTRDDPIDAILDAVIGLEVLLGKGADAISYKIRMRAAALSSLRKDRQPEAVLKQVKAIYEFRSKVVHGDTSGSRKSKKLKTNAEEQFEEQRSLATDLLRFVVDVLVEHPKFLEPDLIDTELLLGFFKPPGTELIEEPNLPGIY